MLTFSGSISPGKSSTEMLGKLQAAFFTFMNLTYLTHLEDDWREVY